MNDLSSLTSQMKENMIVDLLDKIITEWLRYVQEIPIIKVYL